MRVFSNLRVFEKFEIDFMVGIRDRLRRERLRNIRCSVVASVFSAVVVVAAVQIPSGRGEEFTSRHMFWFLSVARARFSPKALFAFKTLNNGIQF